MSSIINNTIQSIEKALHIHSDATTADSTGVAEQKAEDDHHQQVIKQFKRLPTNVKPKHYDLHLTPDLTKFVFTGIVSIDVDVTESTDTIIMNCAEIQIQNVQVLNKADGSQYGTATHSLDEDAETAIITLSSGNKLTAGSSYTVVIQYTGSLNDQLKGFYRSQYTDVSGATKYMAVTQFESTDARRALPCWDEPACKATFTVHISAAKALTVVSNMNESGAKDDSKMSGNVVHSFDPTPIMSTYLLAFVVGEFDYVEDKTKNGTNLRVYTAVGKSEQGKFALDTGKRALEFYNDYFGIPYPLPKMDQLAIPDFSAGAMENWGCITYRETALLVDEANTSTQAKQNIALTVCHEIAHQWFGNIVTMEWWTHLWLNEGYATWMEHFCVDHLFPQWQIWRSYVFGDFASSMESDALVNSHPIEIDVGHPDEVDEIFDIISYSKGSAVIRMLENYLGEKQFQQGLQVYLNKYKYGNALTQDLWAVLQETSKKPVSEVMTAWTKQTGYPLITVSEPTLKNGALQIECKQKRFLSNGDDGGKDLWPVPISFVLPDSTNPSTTQLLHDKQATLTVASGVTTQPAWLKLNAGQTSLFRTLYPAGMYAAFKQAIQSGDASLTPTERLGIQSDAFALARAGMLGTAQVLDLVSAYTNETDYTVWADISSNLSELGHLLAHHSHNDTYKYYARFICALYTPILQKIGWTKQADESSQTTLLRSIVINICGKYGHEATVHQACSTFQKYYHAIQSKDSSAPQLLPADLRTAVYGMAVAHGGVLAYNNAIDLFKLAELNEEKTRILRALGSAQSPHLLRRTLDYAMSDNVRSQDSPSVILTAANNRKGLDITWQFITDNWNELVRRYGGGFALSRLVTAAENYADDKKATEVETFFKTHSAPAAERAIKQTCERIRSNAKWLKRDGDNIRQWLLDNTKGHTHVNTIVE